VLDEAIEDLDEGVASRRAKVRSARLKNITLMGVLSVGAHLSFAALTALGPFIEATRLQDNGELETARERLGNIESQWRTERHGVTLGTDAELKALEELLPTYSTLRKRVLERSFDRLSIAYTDFEGAHDAAWYAADRYTRTRTDKDLLKAIRGDWPEDSPSRPETFQRDFRSLRTLGTNLKKELGAIFELGQKVRARRGAISVDEAAQIENAFRSARTSLDDWTQSVDAADEPSIRPSLKRLRSSGKALQAALEAYRVEYEEAVNAYTNAESTVQRDQQKLLDAIDNHRARRLDQRKALELLDRKAAGVRLEARDVVSRAEDQFSAIQRAGPGWLDRMDRLSRWYERSFQVTRQKTLDCAHSVLEVAHDDDASLRSAIDRLQALPKDHAQLSLNHLTNTLDKFRDTLTRGPDDLGPAIPACAASTIELPPTPEAATVSTTYGAAVGVLSGWLLQSGSLDIVLLAGMLGFGLLGSGLSRIIRRRLAHSVDGAPAASFAWMPGSPDEQPLVDDVPSVVFSGLGATLVVYLAGVGGIGAITAQPPTLDPHVLMLSCFVASVFSEDVWRSAQKWMQKQGAEPEDANPLSTEGGPPHGQVVHPEAVEPDGPAGGVQPEAAVALDEPGNPEE
jgi:hypothetical protein